LKTFAKNAAGETIPDDLIAKMNAGRNFGRALFTRHQMFYAAVSLNYYTGDPADIDLTATMKALQKEYSPYAYVEDTYFHASFGHLYGYS
ncbi:M3 family metallopeptidase, partial [Oceanobacter sp. 2_MG-2023]